MGTQRVHMKGVLPWLVRWACRGSTIGFCSALTALVGRVQNIFFLIVLYFSTFVPNAQQAGQAAVLGRLSIGLCLWLPPPPPLVRGGAHSHAEGGGGAGGADSDQGTDTPRFKESPATSALLPRENSSVFFQLILAPVVHWLALVLRLLCPALYFFIMERRARKES
jgi:hypothetical protein